MPPKKIYKPFSYGSGYGWTGMNPDKFRTNMLRTSRKFKELQTTLKFDAIAFTGSSGCAVGFYLAFQHKIPAIYVRKQDEKSHGSAVECNGEKIQVRRYLIVDDFVSSGETIRRIVAKITEAAVNKDAYPAKAVGILCYDGGGKEGELKVGRRTLSIYRG